MKRILAGSVEHTVSSKKVGKGYNVRCFVNGELNQEIRVDDRSEIGKAAREMLRWEDKCGNISKFATAARRRQQY